LKNVTVIGGVKMQISEIVKRIGQFYVALKSTNTSTEETATRINAILLEDGVRKDDLVLAWDEFAREKGVEK
jgi:hypothetical protein